MNFIFTPNHQKLAVILTPVIFIISAYLIFRGSSPLWLVGSVVTSLAVSLSLSVGYHRLFSHKSFECNRLWHYIFTFFGTSFFHASPISWCYVHRAHHRYSDTEKDSHITDWSIFLGQRYRKIDESLRGISHLLRDNMQTTVHQYGLLLIGSVAGISLLFGTEFFVFIYCLPVAFTTFVMLMFQIYSHDKNGACDRPLLEFILPMSGEWTHKEHHIAPYKKVFGKYDLGSKLIKCIELRS